MKTLVAFIICLFTLAQGQYFVQRTCSISQTNVIIKDWLQKIIDANKNDAYDNNANNAHDVPEDDNNSNKLFTPMKEQNYDVNTEKLETTLNRNNITISNKFNDQANERNNRTCTEKNERYPIPGFCDRYIQCQDGRAEEKQCPDGLRYNHNVKDVNPCQYPSDVQCPPGSSLQPAKSNEVCPNQFGYFKTEDRLNCSSFSQFICENGVGYDYTCPEGLAFNILTYRCDWPDRVPECHVEALHGYRCPDVPKLNNINVTRGYRSSKDCRIYFSCINRRPRRLECDEYFGFDEISQKCVPAFEVAECTDEERAIASDLVRRNADGEYIVRRHDDDYLNTRFSDLKLTPTGKRLKVIA